MKSRLTRSVTAMAAAGLLALGLAACGSTADTNTPDNSPAARTATIETESNLGKHTINTPPERVVALDNGTFALLDEWGVDLEAGAVALMRPDLSYKKDDSVIDIGNHREPNLEQIVAADPDVVISGQRFTQYNEDITKLVPEATVVDYSPRDGQDFAEELKRQVTQMGKIFGKNAEATQMIEEFDASIDRVKKAYNPDQKVLGVITSGGEINFASPTDGRSVGPAFDVLGLTPALEVQGSSTNHEGDDISVEAIADANPDWILVLDRDAAIAENTGESYTPAKELLKDSEALKNVKAVKENKIVYMPQYTYIDESLKTYTEFFNSIADAMEKAA